jgi:hypothetical protein
MRYFGRRGAAFRAVLDGIFFTAFLTTVGTLLGAGLERSGDVILTLKTLLPFNRLAMADPATRPMGTGTPYSANSCSD